MATPVRNALANTIIGSGLRDTLTGTSGDDLIFGYGDGSGTGGLPPPLDSAAGGEADNDSIAGNDGNDTIFGGGGNDNLRGGRGADLIFGDDGADFLAGNDGRDILSGGGGDDRMFGGWGEDSLAGNAGDDIISGDGLADRIAGGDGNDTLIGGAGDDEIDGGRGGDTAVFADTMDSYAIATEADGIVTVTHLDASGGDGSDMVSGVEFLQFADRKIFVAPRGVVDLAFLQPEQGFAISGVDAIDFSGRSVSGAGDANGDGIDDVIIGALRGSSVGNDRLLAGEAYVVYGTTTGHGAALDLATLGPSQGFAIYGAESGDEAGYSVSSAGDVNGDGLDDLIIGAPFADDFYAGRAYVVFGATAAPSAGIDLATLGVDQGFVIELGGTFDTLGWSVSAAGDVNGDGLDDLIVGAPGAADYAGRSFVVFGQDTGFGPGIDLEALAPADGFEITGIDFYDSSGIAVSSAGDVNGDGFDDVIIGSRGDAVDNLKESAGESYVIFGTDGGFGDTVDLATLTPAQGFTIHGAEAYDLAGFSVSSAGDFNGDGVDDLVIGAPGVSSAYVIFGKQDWGSGVDLAALDPAQGIVVESFGAAGISVSAAGDVNGDGFDDVIIGAPGATAPALPGIEYERYSAGVSYVIFGTDEDTGGPINGVALTPEQGVVIFGALNYDYAGRSVSGAGDVNGDGFDDLLVGAPGHSPPPTYERLYAGQSYVIFGGESIGGVVSAAGTMAASKSANANGSLLDPADVLQVAADAVGGPSDPAMTAMPGIGGGDRASGHFAGSPGPLLADLDAATVAA